MARAKRSAKNNDSGFTLTEVIITMVLVSMMCLGVFAGLQQITKATMAIAIRNEAHHLLQEEAERLLSADYASFVAAGNTTITSSVKTSYVAMNSTTTPALSIPSDNSVGRIPFTRRVVEVTSTGTSRTLRVEVEWTWQGRTDSISVPLYRNE